MNSLTVELAYISINILENGLSEVERLISWPTRESVVDSGGLHGLPSDGRTAPSTPARRPGIINSSLIASTRILRIQQSDEAYQPEEVDEAEERNDRPTGPGEGKQR